MDKKIGVLIPAYNEAERIGSTIEAVLKYTENIVVVNDGSKDETSRIVSRYPITLLDRTENKGLAKTVAEGFSYMLDAGYEVGIKMDGDGQMNASKLLVFFETVKKLPDVDVICATYDDDTPWMVRKDMAIYSSIYRLATGIKTSDLLSEYRAYNRKAMQFMVDYTTDEGYGSPLILLDMHRENLDSIEVNGGVSYSLADFRPLPIDAQYALRRAFVTKVFKFPGVRSKIVGLGSIPLWIGLIVFNCTVQPKYHSFLPKKFIR